MAVGKSSRYTPPSPKSARRIQVEQNRAMGLGANNPRTSAYAQGKMRTATASAQNAALYDKRLAMRPQRMAGINAAKTRSANISGARTRVADAVARARANPNPMVPGRRAAAAAPSGYGGLYTAPMGGLAPMGQVNLPVTQQARQQAEKARQRAGSQSVIDDMRRRRGIKSTPVSVRPRTPVAPAPGSPPVAPDTGSKGIRKALGGAIDYAKRKPGKAALIAGAGAIGLGALLGGREKRGTSSGSQGMYKY